MTEDDKKLWEAIKATVVPLGQPNGPRLRRNHPAPPEPRSIDLHGYTVQEAFDITMDFLNNTTHCRVNIITGKSGQICREFPEWAYRHPRVRKIDSTQDGGAFWISVALTS